MPDQRAKAIINADVISDACSWSDLNAILGWQATALAFRMERPRRLGRARWLAEAQIIERPGSSGGYSSRFRGLAHKQATQHARLKSFAGYNLRSGHFTRARLNKVCLDAITRRTGHRSSSSFGCFVRVLGIFDENMASRLGLNGKGLLSIFPSDVLWPRLPFGISTK